MFGQVLDGHTSDPAGVRQAVGRWVQDSLSGAEGWVGATAGVTDDGDFVAVLQFSSEEAARDHSDRREQDRWWADVCAALDGELRVRNGQRTEVFLAGELGQAGFVQVVQGRVSDVDRARERVGALQEALRTHLPALLGTVTVELGDGRFTRALFFTTEEEARAGELARSSEIQEPDQEARRLIVGPLEFLDLHEPWLFSPRVPQQ